VSLRKTFVTNVVRSGCDLKTIMSLARHSTAQLSMETYSAADRTLLRQAAQTAEGRVIDAVARAECCTDVARKIAGAERQTLTASATKPSEVAG
jgi:hypothetical protein